MFDLLSAIAEQGSIQQQRAAFVSALVLGLSVAWTIWYGRQQVPDYPMQALLVVTAYLYFLSGLLWAQAVFCGALVWVAFFLPLDLGPAAAIEAACPTQ